MRWKGRVDVLVNNAGINIRAGIAATSLADWERVFAVNVTGALLGMRAAAPAMREARRRLDRQHRVGGGAARQRVGGLHREQVGAARPHQGRRARIRSWKIRANTVCPGVVPTDLNAGQAYVQTVVEKTPLARNCTPEEVASVVVFLASANSAFVTGADVPVDGGSPSDPPADTTRTERCLPPPLPPAPRSPSSPAVSRGIGRACATSLAGAGFDIVVLDLVEDSDTARDAGRDPRAGAARRVRRRRHRRDRASPRAGRRPRPAFGTIDCLVNNAGVFATTRGADLLDVTPETTTA